jgi:hypothetical protein
LRVGFPPRSPGEIMKLCSKCKIEKYESNFNKNKNRKDGLQHYCKQCKSLINKKYAENNKDNVVNRVKKWKKENRDKCNKNDKQWRLKNPEKYKEIYKKYKINNKAKIRELAKNRWTKHKDKMKSDLKEWRKSNTERLREYERKRIAKKKGLKEEYSYVDEKYIRSLFDNKCFNCGKKKIDCILITTNLYQKVMF